jgi:SAM-dependent methyltransferase
LLSPIYYLNRLDFVLRKKRNPFYTSKVVRLKERYPLVYELAQLVENFPAWHRIYDVLPELAGDVLQVGCGTGLLNKHMRNRSDIRITNLDFNLNALRTGIRLGRYSSYVHAAIDKGTPLPDRAFDAIVFAQSFHHIRNHKKAFVECARLLRDNGCMIIADSVVLHMKKWTARPAAYLGNSSIDGVIWRFTLDTFVKHLEECLPSTVRIQSVESMRRLHVTNYNLFVPQCDVVAVLVKGTDHAGQNHPVNL